MHHMMASMFSFLFLLASTIQLVTSQLYMDPLQPIPDRVADLLKQMTIDEKITQLFEPYSNPNYAHEHYAKTGVGWLSLPGSNPEEAVMNRNKEQQFFMNRSVSKLMRPACSGGWLETKRSLQFTAPYPSWIYRRMSP